MRRKALPTIERCLNCGTEVQGNFCHVCGQESTNRTTSLQPLFADFVSDVLSFDSKLMHTLVPLLLSPGRLTTDYNLGKRVRYLSPLKIYLFMSVLFFLLLAWHMGQNKQSTPLTLPTKPNTTWKQKSAIKINLTGFQIAPENMPPSLSEYDAWQKDPKNPHPQSPFEQYMVHKAFKVAGNVQGFADEFVNTIPKAMFVLLPLFALILKGIYFRSKRYYVEHLVFALHVHAFVFAQLSLMQLPKLAPIMPVLFLWMPLYLFLAMRRVYGQGLFKTLLKMGILGTCYLFLLVLLILLAGVMAVFFF